MILYFESGRGCGLREASNIEAGKRAILEEVGTYTDVSLVRKATKDDILWIVAGGGYVPDTYMAEIVKQ